MFAGGTDVSLVIYLSATLYVSAGGVLSSALMSGNDNNLGTETNVYVASKGSEVVYSGGVDSSARIQGEVLVLNGASEVDGSVEHGGVLTVDATASVSDEVLAGSETNSGRETGTTIDLGGSDAVQSGGSATDATVLSGGMLNADPGATLDDTEIDSGVTLDVASGVHVISTLVLSDGGVTIDPTGVCHRHLRLVRGRRGGWFRTVEASQHGGGRLPSKCPAMATSMAPWFTMAAKIELNPSASARKPSGSAAPTATSATRPIPSSSRAARKR